MRQAQLVKPAQPKKEPRAQSFLASSKAPVKPKMQVQAVPVVKAGATAAPAARQEP